MSEPTAIAQGLYVTVAGMALVFFALTILLFAMVLLDRFFPRREAPPEAPALPASSPAASAGATAPPATAPAAPPPATDGVLDAVLGDQRHRVELRDLAARPMRVVVDGEEHRVESRDGGAAGLTPELVIDGRAYPVRLVEVGPEGATVRVGDESFEVRLPPPAPAPEPAPAAAPPVAGEPVAAPLPGRVLRVSVGVGDRVARGQEVCVIEAMKMENSIRAPRDGTVREVRTQPGQSVTPGQVLVVL